MVLRRPDVVAGALDLLDAEGLDGLTMRKLGAALNVQGGALYRHFPSKEALLEAMAEQLAAAAAGPLPPELTTWQEQLRELGVRMRAALLARRDGARVVAGTFVSAPNTTSVGNQAIGALCDAGFPPEEAGWTAFACFYYVLGHTIEEQGQVRLGTADDWTARIDAADPPLAEPFGTAMRALAAADPGERFRYGLDLLIAGLERQLETRAAR